LLSYLGQALEVDLINCDFEAHGKFCEDTARRFSMEISNEQNLKAVYLSRQSTAPL
jgi:hypothetical protein